MHKLTSLHCVASISARVRRESWEESKKKRNDGGGGGERRNRNNSIVNACYAGYLYSDHSTL